MFIFLAIVSIVTLLSTAPGESGDEIKSQLRDLDSSLRSRKECTILFAAFDRVGLRENVRNAIYRIINPNRAVTKALVREYKQTGVKRKVWSLRLTFNKLFHKNIEIPCKLIQDDYASYRKYIEDPKLQSYLAPLGFCDSVLTKSSKEDIYRGFKNSV